MTRLTESAVYLSSSKSGVVRSILVDLPVRKVPHHLGYRLRR